MAQFLGDIAWMLELFAITSGFVVLHRATKEAPAKLLQAAGWILILGGIAAALCTGYYWFRYQEQGHFDAAHARGATMVSMPHDAVMHRDNPK